MTRLTLTLSVVLIGGLFGACASTQTGGGGVGAALLGERTVDFGLDRDAIHVGGDEGRFRALRVVVRDSPLEMYDIKVTFGNGKVWSPPTRLSFAQGSWTRRIDLPGKGRYIKKIVFFYRSKGLKSGKAHVKVWGVR